MSDYETVTGRLKKHPMTEDDALSFLKKVSKEKYLKDYDTAKEALLDMWDDKFVELNGEVYEIFALSRLVDQDDYCNLQFEDELTFNFTTRFYNGGANWAEMVEDKLKKSK